MPYAGKDHARTPGRGEVAADMGEEMTKTTTHKRKQRSDAGLPRKVRSFRESIETKRAQTCLLAHWNCRACGHSVRQVVSSGEIARCPTCGQEFNVSIDNTTIRIQAVKI